MAAAHSSTGAGSPTLLLVPTELELRCIEQQGGIPAGHAIVRLCGFGALAAAARCAGILARITPRRVLLVGIAGAYDTERDPPGLALEFSSVAIDGIGVGEGRERIAPPALGARAAPALDECLPLACPRESAAGLLLTACAASASRAAADARRERFPEARAEDMEGFAVACACQQAGVPLRIVRGISNRVGEREPERWNLAGALAAARQAALAILESTW